ncbi:MAG: hypothetical protein KU37_04495 [Sulfuricurvum sp. PC08-66]|nr:MAG: hypothetical protein KU37_04495 [Sulfuricurvum sp. PC08-66]
MMTLLFVTLALLALGSALAVILSHQVLYAALWLIVMLLALAGVYALLGSSFLFIIQIIIYAGAIISLLLFIIMFLNIQPSNLPQERQKFRTLGFAALLVAPFAWLLGELVTTLDVAPVAVGEDFGAIGEVGLTLFYEYLLPFELISLLLLVSLIGAIRLAQKEPHDLL